jgi:hypothetical protein
MVNEVRPLEFKVTMDLGRANCPFRVGKLSTEDLQPFITLFILRCLP